MYVSYPKLFAIGIAAGAILYLGDLLGIWSL